MISDFYKSYNLKRIFFRDKLLMFPVILIFLLKKYGKLIKLNIFKKIVSSLKVYPLVFGSHNIYFNKEMRWCGE